MDKDKAPLSIYLHDVIESTDLSDVSVTRHHEEIYGTAIVEYRSVELFAQDAAENWAYALDALEQACIEEYGISWRQWKYVGRDGRWARFTAP
jgi:hypothetical protein